MKFLSIILACILFVGCTSAGRSKLASYGRDHSVELYSGGKMVRSWATDGKVSNEADSDGFYFTDAETRVLVRVSGDLVITPLTGEFE